MTGSRTISAPSPGKTWVAARSGRRAQPPCRRESLLPGRTFSFPPSSDSSQTTTLRKLGTTALVHFWPRLEPKTVPVRSEREDLGEGVDERLEQDGLGIPVTEQDVERLEVDERRRGEAFERPGRVDVEHAHFRHVHERGMHRRRTVLLVPEKVGQDEELVQAVAVLVERAVQRPPGSAQLCARRVAVQANSRVNVDPVEAEPAGVTISLSISLSRKALSRSPALGPSAPSRRSGQTRRTGGEGASAQTGR